MTADNNTSDERNAAVAMLREGLAGLSEVAELAGESRQLVRYWARSAGVDWQASRSRFLAAQWRRKLAAKRR
jgi:hypothetical protein